MRAFKLLAVALMTALAVSACSADRKISPITPASDMPTFLYFYTEG